MFLKVYFLNFRYFFIAKKQQLVLYFYITYGEIENNQPRSGHLPGSFIPTLGNLPFLKKCLCPGASRGGGGGGGGGGGVGDGHCWN